MFRQGDGLFHKVEFSLADQKEQFEALQACRILLQGNGLHRKMLRKKIKGPHQGVLHVQAPGHAGHCFGQKGEVGVVGCRHSWFLLGHW